MKNKFDINQAFCYKGRMKKTQFKLETSGYNYSKKEAKRLESLGFKFEKAGVKRFKLDHTPILTLTSLEDLLTFCREWGPLVIDDDKIEIYDDYRE